MRTYTSGYQVLTSAGPAAIATVRVCGRAARAFLGRFLRGRALDTWSPGAMMRAALLDERGEPIDDVLVTVRAGSPDWDVRVHLHGSPWLVRRCVELLDRAGLRPLDRVAASPWPTECEVDAEAYALMPRVLTLRGLVWVETQRQRLVEEVRRILAVDRLAVAARRCRSLAARGDLVDWFLRPLRVAIVGPPNAGKSTLTNALARDRVSLVSPRPGTTRDWVEASGEVGGLPVAWLDTAGLRVAGDAIEAEGVKSALGVRREAHAVLLVLDGGDPPSVAAAAGAWTGPAPSCVVINKLDLGCDWCRLVALLPESWRRRVLGMSAESGQGLGVLGMAVLGAAGCDPAQLSMPATFTRRQREVVRRASLARSVEVLRARLRRVLRPNSVAGGRNVPI